MSKDQKNGPAPSNALNSFHQQFNQFPNDLKIMITLSGLNGTQASIVNSFITASTIAAIRELDSIKDDSVRATQEMIIISTLELSRNKLTKPS